MRRDARLRRSSETTRNYDFVSTVTFDGATKPFRIRRSDVSRSVQRATRHVATKSLVNVSLRSPCWEILTMSIRYDRPCIAHDLCTIFEFKLIKDISLWYRCCSSVILTNCNVYVILIMKYSVMISYKYSGPKIKHFINRKKKNGNYLEIVGIWYLVRNLLT